MVCYKTDLYLHKYVLTGGHPVTQSTPSCFVLFESQQKLSWKAELISEYCVRVQYRGVECNGAIQLWVYAEVARPWSKIGAHHEYTLLINHCSPLTTQHNQGSGLWRGDVWYMCWKLAFPQNDYIIAFHFFGPIQTVLVSCTVVSGHSGWLYLIWLSGRLYVT